MEEVGVAEHRDELLEGLKGRVVEIGCGNGLNFVHYPEGVESVLAVEPEPHLRRLAERAAADAPVEVTVVDGIAEDLPAVDDSFDGAVASLVLCSVGDQGAALAEARRVLRPGGELRFYEHVAGDGPLVARIERFMDATFWPRVAGGCHSHRDTVGAIRAADFEVEAVRSFEFPRERMPLSAHVMGRARSATTP
ncbi:MAG: class I SAM-dependent methyltransferase [Nitriliruptorales bacterium]